MKSFVELTRKEKIIELLRWICVLPVAMLGFSVAYYVGGILLKLAETIGMVGPPSVMGFNRYLRYLIWLLPMGVAFVMAGAKTAPRCRLATASILAVLWILWTGKIHHWDHESAVAATVAAAGGVAFLFYSERSKGRHAQTDQPAVTGE